MARSDVRLVLRLAPLLRPHRGPLLGALALAAAAPVLMAARIWLLKVLLDSALPGRHTQLLWGVAGAYVAIAMVRGVMTRGQQLLLGHVGTEVVRTLRSRVYSTLQHLSLRYFHGRRLGDLLTRLSGDVGAIEDLLVTGLTSLVSNLVTLLLFLGLLVYLDPMLVAVAGAMVPVLAVLTFVEARRGRRGQLQVREATSELTSTAEEGLSAIALVKAFGRSAFEVHRFTRAASDSAAARMILVRLRATFPPLSDLVTAVGTAVVVVVGAEQVLAGRLSTGSFVVFISYLASLYVPLQGLGRLGSTVQRALVGAERIDEILATPPALRERRGGPRLPPLRGRVTLDRVTFGYQPHRPVLHGVSLELVPGEMVAVIGASGAGKTTLVSLLLGFYDPDSGAVRVDGHVVGRHDLQSLRDQVAAVLQEPMLFDTTVSENIRYGRLDASEEEIFAAARDADVLSFLTDLPEGFDTVVGPRGSRLSGGQRQRVALARALVKQARVVVLDEPTSALDPVTEARVVAGVRRACAGSSVVLVAHRYSTVQHADRVVVLDRGRIVQEGLPEDLVGTAGPYRDFVVRQGAGGALAP